MTNKEIKSCVGTIEMLRRLAYNIHGVMDVIDADNCEKIIKALEQEPCEDAVSRTEVLKLVRFNAFHVKSQIKAIENMPSVTPQEPNTWSLDDAREDFMYDVYNELDFLPTNDEANRIIDSFDMVTKGIKQEPRWIPVSERLPEKSYGCLVTVYDTDLRTQDEFENILPYFVGYDGETWNNADGEPIPFEVTAWMPLPEPYKEDKE